MTRGGFPCFTFLFLCFSFFFFAVFRSKAHHFFVIGILLLPAGTQARGKRICCQKGIREKGNSRRMYLGDVEVAKIGFAVDDGRAGVAATTRIEEACLPVYKREGFDPCSLEIIQQLSTWFVKISSRILQFVFDPSIQTATSFLTFGWARPRKERQSATHKVTVPRSPPSGTYHGSCIEIQRRIRRPPGWLSQFLQVAN